MTKLNIQLLLTGNELMTGDIVDSNSAMIAQELKDLGLEIRRKVTVADELPLLIEEITHISKQADILIINGGLGPTVDDMTAQALAAATKQPLTSQPQALQHITSWCKKRQISLSEPNLKQSVLPKGCEIIANKIGSAVGFQLRYQACDIYCSPGVPHELKAMLTEQIIPKLKKQIPSNSQLDISRLQVFGLGESSIQKLINDNYPDWPKEVSLGFRAGKPLLEVKLTTQSKLANNSKQQCLNALNKLLGDHIISTINKSPKTLATHLVKLLAETKKTITLAESCTGGLIASLLTRVPGSSNVFEAGYISYANNVKKELLSVKSDTLNKYGAVSQATVIEMAQGALVKSAADVVIAVSGIAGPTGGSEDKPIGTVWIAWGNKEQIKSKCLLIPTERYLFQQYVANIGLDLIRRLLINSQEIPTYFIERGVK